MTNYSINKYGAYNFDMFKGRDLSLVFQIYDVTNEVGVDITSVTLTSVARQFQDISSPTIFEFNITKTDPVNGYFTLGVAASVTATLTQSYLFYDILYTSESLFNETYVYGKIGLIGVTTNYVQ